MTDEERMEYLSDDMAEWLSELSPERRDVITDRMRKMIEDTVGEWTDDTDPVLVETAFIEAAEIMFLQDQVQAWVENDLVNCIGIDGDGNFMYAAR